MIISLNKIGGGSGGGTSIKYEVVTVLPSEGKVGIIYLIESKDPQEGDKYEEYIWLSDEGKYEKLGSMPKIDLDNYYTKEETDIKFDDFGGNIYVELEKRPLRGEVYDRTEMDYILGEKQDTLTAGEGIYISNNVISTSMPKNEIWYTSIDEAVVTPRYVNVFGANIISNTYINGKGIIKFDGNVTTIGGAAFYNNNGKKLKTITIPNSVTSIGGSAFDGCSALTNINIPNSVTSIGNSAFHSCSGLKSIEIPNSVTSIGQTAFDGCSALTSVTIPNSVTSIGGSAFPNCSNLTSITIPNSITSISIQAFRNCSRLSSITIPNSVTSIGSYAFYGLPTSGTLYCDEDWFNNLDATSKGYLYNVANWTRIPLPKTIEERVDEVETKVDDLETRVDEVETKVDEVETKVNGLFQYDADTKTLTITT